MSMCACVYRMISLTAKPLISFLRRRTHRDNLKINNLYRKALLIPLIINIRLLNYSSMASKPINIFWIKTVLCFEKSCKALK